MRDPYEILGVRQSASDADIKSAYRTLAKRFHPDVDPGNAAIAERFKEVSAAYEFLKDKVRRSRYDRGEIDASGSVRRRHSMATAQQAWAARTRQAGPAAAAQQQDYFGFGFNWSAEEPGQARYQDLFAELFGGFKPQGRRTNGANGQARNGEDVTYRLKVSFIEAAGGTTRRVRLPNGRRLDLRIPPGMRHEQHMRLKGMGNPGMYGGTDGDALIVVDVEEHAHFSRKGRDVLLDLPITVYEAVLGGRVEIPTLSGPVQLTIPAGSDTGTQFRMKGKGIPTVSGDEPPGDQIITLRVILPKDPPKDFVKIMKKWADKSPYDVRTNLNGE